MKSRERWCCIFFLLVSVLGIDINNSIEESDEVCALKFKDHIENIEDKLFLDNVCGKENTLNDLESHPMLKEDSTEEIIPARREWTEKVMSAVSNTGDLTLVEANTEKTETKEKMEYLRFNYASEQCGAKIVDSIGVARGQQNILSGSQDSYMLSYCGSENWIILELCEEIVIDSIVLSNMEYYSSTFKDFIVYGSKRFPTEEWNEIDRFTAENIKSKQNFSLEKKEIYRYLKIEFISSYGNEYYCPVTLLKVYGYSLVEDLREQVELSQLKIKNFNKLMGAVIKPQEENEWDELPAVPAMCDMDDIPPEVENAQLFEILNAFIANKQGDEDNDDDPSANIFAELASHSMYIIFRNFIFY